MIELNLLYLDFDGCLANTPSPEPGKDIWSEYYNTPYPHLGWWGRIESMDPLVFDIKTHQDQHDAWMKYYKLGYKSFIHTSRQPKFEPIISEILNNNNIVVDGILTAKGKFTKGERILDEVYKYINNGFKINHIVFYDDRMKEIITVEAIREELKSLGITIDINKVQSDATD